MSPKESRIWRNKKESLRADLKEAEERSPILRVLHAGETPNELRAVVSFGVPTLVAPLDGEVRLDGPVIAGIRYLASYLSSPPVPWEVVTILSPADAFHANIHRGGGLCIGRPPAGLSMEYILHVTYAAITLQSYNSIEWEGLNHVAAEFIRRHAARWPIVPTGLFEAPDQQLRRENPARPPFIPLLPGLESMIP